jgi:hypothetical protein
MPLQYTTRSTSRELVKRDVNLLGFIPDLSMRGVE